MRNVFVATAVCCVLHSVVAVPLRGESTAVSAGAGAAGAEYNEEGGLTLQKIAHDVMAAFMPGTDSAATGNANTDESPSVEENERELEAEKVAQLATMSATAAEAAIPAMTGFGGVGGNVYVVMVVGLEGETADEGDDKRTEIEDSVHALLYGGLGIARDNVRVEKVVAVDEAMREAGAFFAAAAGEEFGPYKANVVNPDAIRKLVHMGTADLPIDTACALIEIQLPDGAASEELETEINAMVADQRLQYSLLEHGVEAKPRILVMPTPVRFDTDYVAKMNADAMLRAAEVEADEQAKAEDLAEEKMDNAFDEREANNVAVDSLIAKKEYEVANGLQAP